MDSNKFKTLLWLIVALFGAVYLGIASATAQLEVISWVVVTLCLAICVLMGRKIWLLIPLLGGLQLTFSLPGRPDTLLVAQLVVIGFSCMFFLLRKLPYQFKLSELEIWMFLLAAMIGQVYLRNPVSVSILGGDDVGGKPYIIFGITIAASFLLAGLKVPEAEIKTALRLSIIGGLLNFSFAIVGKIFPVVGYWTGTNYAIVTGGGFSNQAVDSGLATREGFLMTAAKNMSHWISAFRSPLRACFHPVWGTLILVSIAFAGGSGFRSAISIVGITYLIGIYYRGGFIEVFIAGVAGCMGVFMLAIVNMAFSLPPNVQRSLAFLPGTWEQRYLDSANESTDWRVEMWKEALLSEHWIHNKLLGDGLGFSAKQLQYQMSLQNNQGARIGLSGFDLAREGALAAGDYHSTFVSSIRTCGYVGALILILAIARGITHAHRLIRRTQGTEWHTVALFFGIPLIGSFFWFPFGAGTFLQTASIYLYQISMLRILENNLPWDRINAPTAGNDEASKNPVPQPTKGTLAS